MTIEEQIIAEAKKHYNDINCFNAFIHGVGWTELHPANVWHEAKEKPRAKEWLLLQISEDSYLSMYLNEFAVDNWVDVFCNTLGVVRYAYIKNLLPKGGENE